MGGEKFGQSLVAVWLAGVFGDNNLFYPVLDTFRSDEIAFIGGNAAVEEILELEQTLGSLYILVGGHAADG